MNVKFSVFFLLVFSILIFGCKPEEVLIDIGEIETVEESSGSGFLEIETSPADAGIYVDNIYGGKSPSTLFNVEVGSHTIIIKKQGYEDSVSEINIEAGRKSYLDVKLISTQEEETLEVVEEKDDEIEETVEEIIEIVEEEIVEGTLEANGVVNIGKRFTLFYDFSKGNFTNIRLYDSDIFSKRFQKYIVFTRFDPVNIKVIEKVIDEVEKEDCVDIRGQYDLLYSGQSLCVITIEGRIAALGGNWDNTENTKLTWKLFG